MQLEMVWENKHGGGIYHKHRFVTAWLLLINHMRCCVIEFYTRRRGKLNLRKGIWGFRDSTGRGFFGSSEITEWCFFFGHGVSPRLFSGLPHLLHNRQPYRCKWDF